MAFFQKPADQKDDAVNYGDYLNGPNPVLTKGIRRFPYSFDMTINPLTYADFNRGRCRIPNSEEHNAGEIWAAVLWDMHWLLVGQIRLRSPISTTVQRATISPLQLVMDGLKIQPAESVLPGCSRCHSRGRCRAKQGVNFKEIWTAFARRGMGSAP